MKYKYNFHMTEMNIKLQPRKQGDYWYYLARALIITFIITIVIVLLWGCQVKNKLVSEKDSNDQSTKNEDTQTDIQVKNKEGELTIESADNLEEYLNSEEVKKYINDYLDKYLVSQTYQQVINQSSSNIVTVISQDEVVLGAETSGDYVAIIEGSNGLIGGASSGEGTNINLQIDEDYDFEWTGDQEFEGEVDFENDVNFHEPVTFFDPSHFADNIYLNEGVDIHYDNGVNQIGLTDIGSSNTTSGASLIGVYDELSNSDSSNIQDVLDDLDQAISDISGSSVELLLDGDPNDYLYLNPVYSRNLFINPDGGGGNLGIGYDPSVFSTGVVAAFNGNVGIGTSDPTEQLEITGNFKLPESTSTTGIIKVGDDNFLHNYGSGNTFLGINAGNLTTTSSYNVGIGDFSLNSITSGRYNVAIGPETLFANDTGMSNIAIGYYAAYENLSGLDNIAIGDSALYSNMYGDSNIAIGTNSLASQVWSGENIAIGQSSLQNSTTGARNTAIGGNYTLYRLTTGENNTVIGHGAGQNVSIGNSNVLLGHNSGYSLTTGSDNILLGESAGAQFTTGSGNIILGLSTSLSATVNRQMLLGDLIYGDLEDNLVGIGTTSPDTTLHVEGQIKITGGSPGAGKVLTSDDDGLASWQDAPMDSDWFINGDDLYSGVTGNVGIGIMTPLQKLTVNADLLNSYNEGYFSAGNLLFSQLEGGSYFGKISVTENVWSLSNYGDTWIEKESSRRWIDIAMSSDGKIQAAANRNGQIYVSVDYGDNWIPKASDRAWFAVAMSADGKIQTALARSDYIYISTDYGNSWTAKDSIRNWTNGLAMSADGRIQTALVEGGMIYVSIDYGNSWTAKDSNRNWLGIAMSSDGKIQTAVTNGGEIYISTDYGETWTVKESFRWWFDVDMSADGKIQTAVVDTGQIYVSTDYGNTWTAKESNRGWNDISMSSDGEIQVATVIAGQIYLSIDYGNTWTAKNSDRDWSDIAISSDGRIISAVGHYTPIYVSTADTYIQAGNVSIGGNFLPSGTGNSGQDIGSSTSYFNAMYADQYYGKNLSIAAFDLAEEYLAVDESIVAGDVVVPAVKKEENSDLANQAIRIDKSNEAYQETVLGVISTDPAIVLSNWLEEADESQNFNESSNNGLSQTSEATDEIVNKSLFRPVALAGRVPVKVSTENGEIKKGDFLVASDKAGYAMKACGEKSCQAGRVIGIALEDFAGDDQGDSEGVTEKLVADKEAVSEQIELMKDQVVEEVEQLAQTDSLSNDIEAEQLQGEIDNLNQLVEDVSELTKPIEDLEEVKTGEGRVMMFVSLSWYEPQLNKEALTTDDQSMSDLINILSNDKDINGDQIIVPSSSEGNEETWYNFITNLIFQGKVIFEKAVIFLADVNIHGPLHLTGPLYLQDRIIIENKDTVGIATIPAGENKVDIKFEHEYSEKPIIMLTLNSDDSELDMPEHFLYFVDQSSKEGFTIRINHRLDHDSKINWQALFTSHD